MDSAPTHPQASVVYASPMPNYRRIWIPGGTYFFTVTVAIADRKSNLLVEHVEALRRAFLFAHRARPFVTHAAVVLPDHIHAIWTLPADDAYYATRWSHIKAEFSRAMPARERVSASRSRKRERGIWQRRYWARAIVDEYDFGAHVDYVHISPVKHGLAAALANGRGRAFIGMCATAFSRKRWGAPVTSAPRSVG